VKTNVGHLETAAGMAGLVKALYCMRHREIPPSLHFEKPNPAIPFDEWNLEVVAARKPLPAAKKNLVIGINSFGFGGANAHVVLQSHGGRERRGAGARPDGVPLVVSGRSDAALREAAGRLARWLRERADLPLYDLAYNAARRRDWHEHRAIVYASDREQAASSLATFAETADAPGIARGRALKQPSTPVFVYSGNGSQWPGMGRALLAEDATFRKAVEEADKHFAPLGGYSIVEALRGADLAQRLEATEVAQPLLFAVQAGVTEMLRAWGIAPAAVLGHSVGEVAAGWACGALSLEQAVRLVYHRSSAQARTRGAGGMTAVALGAQEVRTLLDSLGLEGRIAIGAVNSPRSVTLSGPIPELGRIEAVLGAKGINCKRLALDYAFHSSAMDAIRDDVCSALAGLRPAAGALPFYSAVTGELCPGEALDASYWWRNIREPVEFGRAISGLIRSGKTIYVEVGPQPVMRGYIGECFAESAAEGITVPTMTRSGDSAQALRLRAFDALIAGCPADLTGFFPREAPHVDLPPYPWQRETQWYRPSVEGFDHVNRKGRHPLLGYRVQPGEPRWEAQLDGDRLPMLRDHVVGDELVLPAAAFAEMALAAAAEQFECEAIEVEELEIRAPLVLERERSKTVRLELDPADGSFRIKARERLSDDAWRVHALGRVAPSVAATAPAEALALPARAAEVAAGDHYRITARAGLGYGPAFQTVSEAWVERDAVIARLASAPACAAAVLHPASLDGAFQLLAHALGDAAAAGEGIAFVPVSIAQLTVLRPGAEVCYARLDLVRRNPRTALANLRLFDAKRELVAILRGVRYHAVALRRSGLERLSLLAERTVSLPVRAEHAPADLPALEELVAACEAQLHAPRRLAQRRQYYGDVEPLLEAMLAAIAGEPGMPDPRDIWLRLLRDYPEHSEEIIALGAAARGAPVVEAVTQTFPCAADFNRAICAVLEAASRALPGGVRLRVLAPEAGDSAPVLDAVGELDPERYDVRSAADANRFDVVLADGAAIRGVPGALGRVRDAAKPGGLLVLLERRETLAVLRGRPEAARAWRAPLEQCGFAFGAVVEDLPGAEGGAYLLFARASAQAASGETRPHRHWLVIGDEAGAGLACATALAAELKSRGDSVLFAQPARAFSLVEREGCLFDPQQAADWEALLRVARDRFSEVDGIVHCHGLGAGALERQVDRCLSLKAMLEACATLALSPACWLVTARARERTEDAPFAGFARSAMNEYPDISLRLADLVEPQAPQQMAAQLAEALSHPDAEDEIAVTREGRRVVRLQVLSPEQAFAPCPQARSERSVARLETAVPGQLKSLGWVERELAVPADDEVEIEVRAAGLNFRDVMYAMRQLPDEALENCFAGATLGMEVSGVVAAAGAAVADLAPGDEVIAFAPAGFSSRVVTTAAMVVRKPAGWSFEAAATVPAAFFTAWYALEHLARLREGERVLIHGGAGGVGVAALQIAKAAGAEVYATAGSEAKRDFLRYLGADHVFDSRSLAFADEVLGRTAGEGVDVVLNSLAGEAMLRSLRLLKPFGRFLELGKRDYLENTRIGLRPMRQNVIYFAIDADELMRARPALARAVLDELMAAFDAGRFAPLPCRVFPAKNALDAFRYMQQARHIGKIVLGFEPAPVARAAPGVAKRKLTLRPDATYLVTGGLRGFGLSTAAWLARKGARHLVLAGRSAPDAEAAAAIATLRASGVNVREALCDVADRASLETLLGRVRAEMPPLRGVVHAAAVFRDGLVRGLERAQIRDVLAPKVLAARLLDELTRADPLEFFVLYSSATTFFGSPGQASYVAANLYLERLAQARRARGLPALAVCWGPIADAGYLARNAKARAGIQARLGSAALPAELALDALEQLLAGNATGLGVVDLAGGGLPRLLGAARSPRFERLRALVGEAASAASGAEEVRRWLAELDEAQLTTLFTELVKKEIGEILRMPPERVDAQRALQDLGLDSLMGVELMTAVEARFGVNIPVMALSETATVERLVARILRELRREDAGAAPPERELAEEVRLVAAQHAADVSREEIDEFAAEFRNGGK
jgi:acyl carrier protein